MKNKVVLVFIVSLIAVLELAWYESLPHPVSGPSGSAGYWVIYTLTASGNHAQLQTRYNNGNVYTNQINCSTSTIEQQSTTSSNVLHQ